MRRTIGILLASIMMIAISSCAIRTAQSTPLPPQQQSDAGAEELYQKAETYYRNNFLSKALENYLAVVERYPQSQKAPAAYYQIGHIYIRTNSYEKAIHYFKLLVSQHPENPQAVEAHYQMGVCYQRLGNHDMVVQSLSYYLNVHGAQRTDEARIMLGDSYMALERWNDALLTFAGCSKDMDRAQQVESLKKARIILSDHLALAEALTLIPRMAKTPVADFTRYHVAQDLIARGQRADAAKILREIEYTNKRYKFYEKAEQLLELAEAQGAEPSDSLRSQPQDLATSTTMVPIPSNLRYSVGVLLPLSGPQAIFGRQVLHGIMQGVDLFGGEQSNFRVVIRDTQGDPQVAAKAVNELADDPNVLAIIGPLLSNCAPAAAEEAEKRGIPLIALSRRETLLDQGHWTFRNFITDGDQVRALIDYATNYQGAFRFAVLYPDNAQGKAFRDLFRRNLDRNRYRIVAEVSYATDETDFKHAIKQLTAAGDFDALFIPDNNRRVALLAPQLVYYGLHNVTLLGTNRWNNDELARTAGSYLKKAVIVDGFFVRAKNPEVVAFIDRFHNQFAQYPTFLAAVGYDTARMINRVMALPGVGNRDRLRRELLNLHDFNGVTGELSISENRETQRQLYLLKVGETRIEEMF